MKKGELAKEIISLDPHPKVVAALAQLEEAVGGRDQIAASLLVAQDKTVEEEILTNLLADPANQDRSLAELCGQTGITIGRVLDMFSKAEGAQAYAKSLAKIYRKLPAVVGDVMDRALPQQRTCASCKGEGKIVVRKNNEELSTDCLGCGATGTVFTEPELERQKIALQLGGFLKDKPGVLINSTTNNVSQTMNVAVLKSTPDFRSATDRLLYPHKEKAQPAESTAEVVDAEVSGPDVLS